MYDGRITLVTMFEEPSVLAIAYVLLFTFTIPFLGGILGRRASSYDMGDEGCGFLILQAWIPLTLIIYASASENPRHMGDPGFSRLGVASLLALFPGFFLWLGLFIPLAIIDGLCATLGYWLALPVTVHGPARMSEGVG